MAQAGPNGKMSVVGVTEPFRKLHPWIVELAGTAIAAARRVTRDVFLKMTLPRDPLRIAERFKQTCRELEGLQDRREKLRERLLCHWAQRGTTEVNGVRITESIGLTLEPDQVVQLLPQELRPFVFRTVPQFDLEAFLKMAEEGKIDREVVRQCLKAMVTVSVCPPKKD